MRLDAGLVTPLAGVWIEIKRGYHSRGICSVTPLAGVWIEMPKIAISCFNELCHSPCGSVD